MINAFLTEYLSLDHFLAWSLSLVATGVLSFFTVSKAFSDNEGKKE